MYSNISQILLLYKTWWYYNKFDSTKSLGIRYQWVSSSRLGHHNGPISQIHQCTCPISRNGPFRTEMCTFLFWMVHCRVWDIVGFVNLVYWNTPDLAIHSWSLMTTTKCLCSKVLLNGCTSIYHFNTCIFAVPFYEYHICTECFLYPRHVDLRIKL